MANKTLPTPVDAQAAVHNYLAAIADPLRRAACHVGASIVGCGSYHYR
jgi:hypothetical protein